MGAQGALRLSGEVWSPCGIHVLEATELFCSFSLSYEIRLGVRHLEAQKGKGGDSR